MFGEHMLWHRSSDVVGLVLCETLATARILFQASVLRTATVPGTGLDAVKRTGTDSRRALPAKGGHLNKFCGVRPQFIRSRRLSAVRLHAIDGVQRAGPRTPSTALTAASVEASWQSFRRGRRLKNTSGLGQRLQAQ